MSKSKKNEAQKIVPVVGMYLTYQHADGITRPTKPLKVTLVDGASLKGRRRGSRRTSTVDFKTLGEFRVATPEEIAAFPVDEDEHEIGALSVSTEPPRPTVAHEPPPPPPPAPEPAANDTEVTALAKVFSSTLETITKQNSEQIREMRERMDRMDQDRRKEAEAMRETINTVVRLVETNRAAATQPATPAPPPAPTEAKDDPYDAALVRRHTAMFELLVPEFVSKCLVLVDLRDPAQRARALEANEVHKMFVKWCADGKRADETPYEHAFYALLKKIPNAKHREDVKRGDKKRVLTPWAAKDTRQVEMFPDQTEAPAPAKASPAAGAKSVLTALDAVEVSGFAKENLWPGLDRKYTETITGLLKSGFTKGEMIDALKALVSLIKGGGSDYVYTPDEILEPTTFRDLVSHARGRK